ncbi:hypothetical protein KP509_21G086600 [Ceratopteris richardii]|uniref:DNA mismatch repair protein PMS1 n=1 Tax=Ceratopteris richardii TaxID=49495 RepID=A0A8T2SCS1_CERRI|nr:hypothetical protein KP509_21G086600 [Ceratopteris richardii]KAH7316288.1 hypothetical protein KP509_21G086600 [Ceratopteris richardii]
MAEVRMAVIKPIDKASVHRICSGQVILDLSMAVKELVENSLDAGATSIEIKLKDYGADSLEVADNGCGVSPDNYQALTLKYHTSKISEFADLQSLSSFGFRGEALSSLCALADLSVVTRTKNESVATHLQFDHSGAIISQKSEARPVGTTVIVSGLFKSLPVRHKEFTKNIRREYSRLLTVLHGYALMAKNVRLVCTHLSGKTRTMILKTQGTSSIKDNIVTVFGTKMAACLEPVNLSVGDGCQIEGFLSKPGAGSGRASGDRQFFYINGRPVELPKVSKMLNELYKSFNSLQFPMAVLNFILPPATYDVNVTPDKRKVFLHGENDLLQTFRRALENIYAPEKYTYTVQKFEMPNLEKESSMTKELPEFETQRVDYIGSMLEDSQDSRRKGCDSEPLEASYDQAEQSDDENQDFSLPKTDKGGENCVVDSLYRKVTTRTAGIADLESFQCNFSSASANISNGCNVKGRDADRDFRLREQQQVATLQHKTVQSKLNAFVLPSKRGVEDGPLSSEEPLLKKWLLSNHGKEVNRGPSRFKIQNARDETGAPDLAHSGTDERHELLSGCNEQSKSVAIHKTVNIEETESAIPEIKCDSDRFPCTPQGDNNASMLQDRCDMDIEKSEEHTMTISKESEQVVAVSSIEFDLKKLCARFRKRLIKYDDHLSRARSSAKKRHFMAASMGVEYVEYGDSGKEAALAAATRELERTFNKADFKKMKVLGQFNLGFILAKLNGDLFIIDQHASDEKYNFERLSRTTVLNRQPLLRPLPLDLSVAEEVIAMTHIETFRKNGFDFIERRDGPPGQKLCLSAVPFSKNITFGSNDVQELISLLADEPTYGGGGDDFKHLGVPLDDAEVEGQSLSCVNMLIRPSRVKAMLASRACRSSIMIGDPLSRKQMQRVLNNLAELDSPWNCPHGRPTMRHLVDLSNLKMYSRLNLGI